MKLLTVFTPTYNRAYILPQLYESLKRQTNKNFCWLIVDDGSSDNTSDLVEGWKSEGLIDIEYIYQQNGGKMRAHNTGVKNCKTELFVCVDSDDYLADNAVELILSHSGECINNQHISGIVAYRANQTDKKLLSTFNLNAKESTLTGLYDKGFKGETSLVFKTDVLKNYLFPEIEGEKFITEHFVYFQIDQKYKMLILPQPLIVGEYLTDGYTKSLLKLKKNNPKGYIMYYDMLIKNIKSVTRKIRYATALNSVLILSGTKSKNYTYQSGKFLRIITYPLAAIVCKKYKKQLEKDK